MTACCCTVLTARSCVHERWATKVLCGPRTLTVLFRTGPVCLKSDSGRRLPSTGPVLMSESTVERRDKRTDGCGRQWMPSWGCIKRTPWMHRQESSNTTPEWRHSALLSQRLPTEPPSEKSIISDARNHHHHSSTDCGNKPDSAGSERRNHTYLTRHAADGAAAAAKARACVRRAGRSRPMARGRGCWPAVSCSCSMVISSPSVCPSV